MGFNKRKMGDARRQEAEKEAAGRRATDRQILEDTDHLIAAWNDRHARRMPMLFSPTIGAATTAGYWFLRARCLPRYWRYRPADARLAPRCRRRAAHVLANSAGDCVDVDCGAGAPAPAAWPTSTGERDLMHRPPSALHETAIAQASPLLSLPYPQ